MSKRPTHDLVVITGDGELAEFHRVAALWTTKDGTGYTGAIPAGVTITGRIGIFARKEKAEAEG
jgi:hypothetical protein